LLASRHQASEKQSLIAKFVPNTKKCGHFF
jgi:hypothetical protein